MADLSFDHAIDAVGFGNLTSHGDMEIVGEIRVPFPADIRLIFRDSVIEYQETTPYYESIIRVESESGKIYQDGQLMATHFLDDFRERIDHIVNTLDQSPNLKVIKP